MPTRLSTTRRGRTPRYTPIDFSLSASTLWLEFWAPLLVWCALVLYFSSDALSYDETSGWFTPLARLLFPAASADALDLLHQVIRKLAHIVEFSVTGWLVLRAVGSHRPDFTTVVRAVALVVMLAGIDELHQAMTATRGPSLADVGYDCIGGAIGIGWTLTRSDRRS